MYKCTLNNLFKMRVFPQSEKKSFKKGSMHKDLMNIGGAAVAVFVYCFVKVIFAPMQLTANRTYKTKHKIYRILL